MQNAKCFLEADREILLQKVGQYYRGKSLDECCESFQRFVQFTACALLAVQAVSTATSERLLNIWSRRAAGRLTRSKLRTLEGRTVEGTGLEKN